MTLKFVTGESALLAGKTLVIADTHIGVEREFRISGIKLPSQTEGMIKRLDKLLKMTKANKLAVVGDVKHKVPGISWQELKEIPAFFRHFEKKVKVEVIPGNHDGDLGEVVPGIKMHPGKGKLFGDAYLSHGHAWPGKEFLKAKYLVIAHSHPLVELKDRLGHRWMEPVWARTELKRKRIEEKYGKLKSLPELVIMPSFNPFAGGVAVNRDVKEENLLGPILKSADMKKARLYMLDGTLLGTAKQLTKS